VGKWCEATTKKLSKKALQARIALEIIIVNDQSRVKGEFNIFIVVASRKTIFAVVGSKLNGNWAIKNLLAEWMEHENWEAIEGNFMTRRLHHIMWFMLVFVSTPNDKSNIIVVSCCAAAQKLIKLLKCACCAACTFSPETAIPLSLKSSSSQQRTNREREKQNGIANDSNWQQGMFNKHLIKFNHENSCDFNNCLGEN